MNAGAEDKGSVLIEYRLMAPGYMVICPNMKAARPKGISVLLMSAVHDWVMENPNLRVRAAVGIVENGENVFFHIWFDEEAKP